MKVKGERIYLCISQGDTVYHRAEGMAAGNGYRKWISLHPNVGGSREETGPEPGL